MDVGRFRLRLSVFCRAVFALGIVGTFSLVVVAVVTLFGAVLTFGLAGVLADAEPLLRGLPWLSDVLPWSPAVVAVGASVCLLLLVWSIPSDEPADDVSTLGRIHAASVLVAVVGCLYVVFVESSVVFVEEPVGRYLQLVVVLGGLVAIPIAVNTAREELAGLREQLLADSHPAEETHPRLAETTTWLALQADIPSPTLRITASDRPESFAVGSGTDAVIVVSTGLCTVLNDNELTAVLAHEVSHLANADSRIMGAVLIPMLMADEPFSTDSDTDDERNGIELNRLKRYGQIGVAILSRGREWYADAGAVALTGSPAALASALERLDSERQKPTTDLRDWEASITALDILPPSDWEHATGPFRTHPSTEKRINRLRQQVVDTERTTE